ncbi:hypothetical protein JXR93_12660 [bacterium]|nr:hypothetical protein [bacterium]
MKLKEIKLKVFYLSIILLLISMLSCQSDSDTNYTECSGVTLVVDGRAEDDMYIKGSFNNWQLVTPMLFKNGRWEKELFLPEGNYGYYFYSKSKNSWSLDISNPLTIYIDDEKSSLLKVEGCNHPSLEFINRPEITNNSFSFKLKYIPSKTGELPDLSKSNITRNGKKVNISFDENDKTFSISESGLSSGKYSYRFYIRDKNGFATKPFFVPIWIEEKSFKWEDAIIYQIMTDRFLNGDSSNDGMIDGVDLKANWMGGDFRGIINKIEDDYFTNLGVNALWISSPIRNTQGKWIGMGGDTRYYTAYHSYWPVSSGWSDKYKPDTESLIEPHFGTEEELQELIDKAHQKGIRVMFDFVPNHVHIESPLWRDYKNGDWFHLAEGTQRPNSNGGYTCGWEQPITCWFTEYLPDINYKNINVMERMIEHVVWMIQHFNIDGLRLDAIRLMILDFTVALKTYIQREVITTGIPFYMVGETFTSDYGWDEIGYYLGKDKLDGQFDFPLFHHISRVFLIQSESFIDFVEYLNENMNRYKTYYQDSLMSNFIGNHDICRALSVANYDFASNQNDPINSSDSQGGYKASELVWSNSPTHPNSEKPFLKMAMAHAFVFSIPGVPVVYQGDEFGMPGANDPDNRRVMIFGDNLSQFQKNLKTKLSDLTKKRSLYESFRYGSRVDLVIEKDIWIYKMVYKTESVIVGFNRTDIPISKVVESFNITIPANGYWISEIY